MRGKAYGRWRERVREGSRHGHPMKDGMGGIEIIEENHMPILVVPPIRVGHLRNKEDRPAPVQNGHELLPRDTQPVSSRSKALRGSGQEGWIQGREVRQLPCCLLL